jgi:phage internal scaffolding protein
MEFITAYGPKLKVELDCGTESMTQQSFKQECDINYILRKAHKTGLIEHVNTYQGDYSDVSNVPTYQEALQVLHDADSAFSSLPSDLRKRFSNDPQEFLDFVHNPDNTNAMAEMGLLKPSAAVVELAQQQVETQPAPEA